MRVQYPMARPEQIARQKERGPDGALRHPYIRHPWREKKKTFLVKPLEMVPFMCQVGLAHIPQKFAQTYLDVAF